MGPTPYHPAAVAVPRTSYARTGGGHVAYQVVGDGPVDLLLTLGIATHLEHQWEIPLLTRLYERLMSFSRLVLLDIRGTGMSDPLPVDEKSGIEHRVDDLLCVLDAVGGQEAAIVGVGHSGPICAMLAASHPGRVSSLVLADTYARWTRAADYPIGMPERSVRRLLATVDVIWGTGTTIGAFAPSLAHDPGLTETFAQAERMGASPGAMMALTAMWMQADVRAVLPTIQAPTLVLHHREDRHVRVEHGRYLAGAIPGATYVELPGDDHLPLGATMELFAGEVQEFVTGVRSAPEPDRVLATVLFTDVVGSTERAASLGDRAWRDLLAEFRHLVRRELERHRGREVDTRGDDFFATFDSPARAVRCAVAIREAAASRQIALRTGVHTGELELTGEGYTGLAVHIGARIAALAAPGEVLATSTVRDLTAGSGITWAPRGVHRLKGVPDEWAVFAVERVR
jgi:class 3 adenylate cyclase